MKVILWFVILCCMAGCSPSIQDFKEKLSDFKRTEVGKDLAEDKFLPPYSDMEAMRDFSDWCNNSYWPSLGKEHEIVRLIYMREEILASPKFEMIGLHGLVNGLVKSSGGVSSIYQYLHNDAAYVIEPTPLGLKTLKTMLTEYVSSPIMAKAKKLDANLTLDSDNEQIDKICVNADLLAGAFGAQSTSRRIWADTAQLMKKNIFR